MRMRTQMYGVLCQYYQKEKAEYFCFFWFWLLKKGIGLFYETKKKKIQILKRLKAEVEKQSSRQLKRLKSKKW